MCDTRSSTLAESARCPVEQSVKLTSQQISLMPASALQFTRSEARLNAFARSFGMRVASKRSASCANAIHALPMSRFP
ncbi:hypothetical protein BURKHO8Y_60114 [Burkholderia sp. 8Y]|nr:hypothetical protein BURKHO8Y_60114 [Burkholderia sp. 8Y]